MTDAPAARTGHAGPVEIAARRFTISSALERLLNPEIRT